jgi:hypothetical protein
VQTLMRLGDPRWLGPFCAAAAGGYAGKARRLLHQRPRWSPQMLGAVRQHLGAHDGAHPAVPLLAMVLGQWGPAAAGAAPELLALLPDAGGTAARALLQIGCQDPDMVPGLRALADKGGDVEAAMGVWQLTGDPRPLAGALLTGDRVWVPPAVHTVTAVGRGLLPLVPAARARLAGTAASTYPERDIQVLAARVVSAAAGDPVPVIPTVLAVLAGAGPSARLAADLAADLATAWPATAAEFTPALRDLLDDPRATVAAARALWRLGTPPAELAAPLIAGITAPYGGLGVGPLLAAMHATDAITGLERLAGRDERIVISGSDDDLVWQDEMLRDEMRAAIADLRTA